jgi:hypothetical protein
MKRFLKCSLAVMLVGSYAGAATGQTAPPQGAAKATPAMQGTAQGSQPVLSPPATADVRLDGKAIVVNYGSPVMRGRKIMGGLVPYGQVWRTGANPATSFTTEADLTIGKLRVPAGKYTLYTLPAAPGAPWMLIVNKQTGQWGTVYKQDMDLGRTAMHAKTLPVPQESMSITFENTTMHATELHVKWESTDEWVEIKTAP